MREGLEALQFVNPTPIQRKPCLFFKKRISSPVPKLAREKRSWNPLVQNLILDPRLTSWFSPTRELAQQVSEFTQLTP